MAERICDATLAKTVRLVIDGEHLGGTRADRLSGRSIRIVHDQADADTGPAERFGAEVERVRVLVYDVELEAVHEHLSDDVTRRRPEQ
jgi:hypothetical protein